MTRAEQLRSFLGAEHPQAECRLVLPHFAGPAALDSGATLSPALTYRGATFAERDSRAAFHVQSLVSQIFEADRISIEAAVTGKAVAPTTFLFGSRSNVLVEERKSSYEHLFHFEFDDNWRICCGGQTFSMPDPSKIDPLQYQNTTDYGVVARLFISGGPVFMVAGLGGRATEGAAYYLRKHWQTLLNQSQNRDQFVVLRFDPPFEVSKSQIVYQASSLAQQMAG